MKPISPGFTFHGSLSYHFDQSAYGVGALRENLTDLDNSRQTSALILLALRPKNKIPDLKLRNGVYIFNPWLPLSSD